jgi:hypothetical protein
LSPDENVSKPSVEACKFTLNSEMGCLLWVNSRHSLSPESGHCDDSWLRATQASALEEDGPCSIIVEEGADQANRPEDTPMLRSLYSSETIVEFKKRRVGGLLPGSSLSI